MNSDILKGKWKQLKGSARNRWGQLTNDDLDKIQGNSEKLIGMLQERYGYARDRAERELNEFLHSADETANAQGRDSMSGQPDQTTQPARHQGNAFTESDRQDENDREGEKKRRVS